MNHKSRNFINENTLLDAFSPWIPKSTTLDWNRVSAHWVGTKRSRSLTVVEFAKHIIGENDKATNPPEKTQQLVKTLSNAHDTLSSQPFEDSWRSRPEYANYQLALAITKVSLATVQFEVLNDNQGAQQLLAAAADKFYKYRRIGVEPVASTRWSQGLNAKTGLAQKRRDKIMQLLNRWPSASTALTVSEIISYIVNESPRNFKRNAIHMLVTCPTQLSGTDKEGDVVSAVVRAYSSQEFKGPFLNPLSFGVIDTDKEFLSSIRHAWRIAISELCSVSSSVKIDLTSHVSSRLIGGPSAGGLIAVAIAATVEGKRMNPCISSSCELHIQDSEENPVPESKAIPWDEVLLTDVGGVVNKSRAAWSKVGIQQVAVTPNGCRQLEIAESVVKPRKVQYFQALYEVLLEENEEANNIDDCCRILSRQWQQLVSERRDSRWAERDYAHHLNCFVHPRFKLLVQSASDSREIPIKGSTLTDQQSIAILSLAFNLADKHKAIAFADTDCTELLGRDILLYDRIGAGKSVATLRFVHLLTDPIVRVEIFGYDAQPLVIRIEGDNWPIHSETRTYLSLIEAVAQKVRLLLQQDQDFTSKATKVAESAMRWKLLVIIVDGFDQMNKTLRNHILQQLNDPNNNDCRWIIATRQNTVNEIFCSGVSDSRWMRIMLDRLRPEEQDAFFEKAELESWRQSVDVNVGSEFLTSPYSLRRLRELLETQPENRLVIESESQLGIVTSRRSLQGLITDFSRLPAELRLEPRLSTLELLDEVLSTIAFQMLLERRFDGKVKQVEPFLQNCKRRFKLNIHRQRNSAEKETETTESRGNAWDIAINVLNKVEFDNRSWIEQLDDELIEFQSRKAMELFGARYLSRYASHEDIFGDGHAIVQSNHPCAWDFVSDTEWFETWRLTIEMPRFPITHTPEDRNAIFDESVMCRSLSVLLRPTKQGLRPTELIFRCWHLFEWDETVFRERNVRLANGQVAPAESIRVSQGDESFVALGRCQLFGADDLNIRKLASNAIELFRSTNQPLLRAVLEATRGNQLPIDLPQRERFLEEWRGKSSIEKSRTFLRVPPPVRSASESIQQGRILDVHQELKVCIQATPVTRSMYRSFDGAFEVSEEPAFKVNGEHASISEILATYAAPVAAESKNADDFPIIGVTMYDAFAFAKWLGAEFRIPYLSEWQTACRADSNCDFWSGDELSLNNANYAASQIGRSHCVGDDRYPPNPWGMFDCHGNVLEWCFQDENLDHQYGTGCGGSFACQAEHCKIDQPRSKFSRNSRDYRMGFRLAIDLTNTLPHDYHECAVDAKH